MTVKTSLGTAALRKAPAKVLRDVDRNVTDKKYTIVFCVVLAVWLASCSCVLYCANIEESDLEKKFDVKNDLELISSVENRTNNRTVNWIKDMFYFYTFNYFAFDSYYAEMGSNFIWVSVLFYSCLLILSMVMMQRLATINPPGLLLISSLLMTLSIVYHTAKYFFSDTHQLEPVHRKFLYWFGPEAVLFTLSLLALLIVTHSRGASAMGSMFKKSFRYYFTCRYLALVGFLVCSAIALLNIFAGRVLGHLDADNTKADTTYWIIYSGSVYMIVLTNILGRMIISATAAAYYWSQDQEPISPFKVMCQKSFAIFRYQFGSACYKATYTSLWFTVLIGPIVGYEFTYYKAAKYCLIFDLLLLCTFDYTIFFIAMYGLRASEAFDQLDRFFSKFTKWLIFTCQNFWSSTFFILLPTNCIMLILMWGLDEHDPMFSMVSNRSYAEIIIIFIPFVLVMGTIEDTRAICIMGENMEELAAMCEEKLETDEDKSEVPEEEPTQVLVITDFSVKMQTASEK